MALDALLGEGRVCETIRSTQPLDTFSTWKGRLETPLVSCESGCDAKGLDRSIFDNLRMKNFLPFAISIDFKTIKAVMTSKMHNLASLMFETECQLPEKVIILMCP